MKELRGKGSISITRHGPGKKEDPGPILFISRSQINAAVVSRVGRTIVMSKQVSTWDKEERALARVVLIMRPSFGTLYQAEDSGLGHY